jgi:uncharacterized protein YbjT (DUF2867 family)
MATSSSQSKVILVTGATGKQGGAVIDSLLKQPQTSFTILAVTRDRSTPKAQKLARRSSRIRIVEGDLDNINGLWRDAQTAASPRPIWGVYSVQVSEGPGVTTDGEIAQGKALIDNAIESGVEMFVYSSVERGGDEESWENETPVAHFRTKYLIERYLRRVTEPGTKGARLRWTILRPVAFMDNLEPGFKTKVFMTALRNHLGEDKRMQWVAAEDVGVFAAKAFVHPEEWDRRAVGLAGDELDMAGMEEAFKEGAGVPLPRTYWFFGSALTKLVQELGLMIGWFASHGYKADINKRRLDHPGLMTLEHWLEDKSLFLA